MADGLSGHVPKDQAKRVQSWRCSKVAKALLGSRTGSVTAYRGRSKPCFVHTRPPGEDTAPCLPRAQLLLVLESEERGVKTPVSPQSNWFLLPVNSLTAGDAKRGRLGLPSRGEGREASCSSRPVAVTLRSGPREDPGARSADVTPAPSVPTDARGEREHTSYTTQRTFSCAGALSLSLALSMSTWQVGP
jgi:hypothetical protein